MKNYTLSVLAGVCCALALPATARLQKPEQQMKPLSFLENKGQIIDQYNKERKDIDYKLSAPGMNVFVGDGSIHYQWMKVENPLNIPEDMKPHELRDMLAEELKKPLKATAYRMDVTLVGANRNAVAINEERQVYVENYYLQQTGGDMLTAATFNKVTYKNVYPNIDWVLHTQNGQLKYDFVVHPGGNPADIKLKFEGATSLALQDGEAVAKTPLGSVTEEKPYSYDALTQKEVASKFKLQGNILSFDVAAHDGTLVIDPTLNWGTYYGGTSHEYAYGLGSDPSGNIYMGGWTQSPNNIATAGAFQTTLNTTNAQDAFMVKFNAAGVRQWGTYYGDAGTDYFWSVAVDASGDVYGAGYSTSTNNVTTAGAHQTTLGGNWDALLVKFSPIGARLWATYYGGSNQEHQAHVTCDHLGNVYLSGETWSQNNIATAGAYQTTLNTTTSTQYDAFLAKFNSSGVRQWGTYFGGPGHEEGWASDCDAFGNVYVSGWTSSTTNIATVGAHQTVHGSGTNLYDGYVAKFTGAGALSWATYYGGNNYDHVYDVSCDGMSNVYISGYTYSTNNIATTGAYQTTLSTGNTYDGFIAKFSPGGVQQWGTYFGGTGADYTWGLAATQGNLLYVAGWTTSTTGIATTGAYQTTLGGAQDAFLLEMNTAAGMPAWCTYYGGTGTEWGYGNCEWSPAGYVYMSGYTQSTASIATTNGHQTSFGGSVYDAFLTSWITDTIVYVKQPYIDTVFCPGDTFKVKYGTTYSFRSGNIFSVQLSNAAGSFATPVVIGTKAAQTDDSIVCVIPRTTPVGSGYRLRIVASNPVRTSFDNGVNIRIRPLPQNLTASSNSPVCVGSTLNLTAATTSTGTILYSWAGPNSYASGQQNPAITNVQTSHAGDYIVTAISEGCIGYDTTTVVVNIIPAIPTAGSNSPVCPTTTLNLTAGSTTPGVSYTWTGPAGFNSTLQNPSVNNVGTMHAGVYSVTATLLGCTSPAGTTNVQVHITTPTPVAGGNNVLCGGASLNLTVATIPGATYSWEGPNNFTSNVQNPVINPAQAWHSGDYIVRATVNGCVSEPDTITVAVNIVSTIGGYASPNDSVCEGETVTFVAIQTNGGPSPVYQWYKNMAAIPGANALLYTTQAIATGDVFYCTMYSVGVCTDPIMVSTDTIKMTLVNIQVTPSARITSNPANPMPGQAVTFYANVTNGGYKPLYQWKKNGVSIPTAVHANWSAANLHPYDKISCEVTSTDACAVPKLAMSDTITVGFPTSVNDVKGDGNMVLYPNPNTGRFTVDIAQLQWNKGTVEVLNAVGQTVYSNTIQAVNGRLEIALPNVASGVYMLKLKDGDRTETIRFTVSK